MDIDDRRARRCALLESVMIAPIDLNHLAKASPSKMWLVDFYRSQLPRNPHPCGHLQPPHRFNYKRIDSTPDG